MSEAVSFVLIELKPGKVSIALRFGQSDSVQVLEGWEELTPQQGARIIADILHGKISADLVAGKPFKEVTLPADYWRQADKN